MSKRPLKFYEFGPFRINITERLLQRDREIVPLTPKVFDTLLVMVENSGHVLEKNELMQTLWPDSFVEESSLTQNVSLLRRALGETNDGRQYIETLPKRGYRFVVDVREVDESENEVVIKERLTREILIEEEEHRATQSTRLQLDESARVRTERRSGLKSYLAVSAIVITAATVGAYFYERGQKTPSFAPRSIAVLPFQTVGKDAETNSLGLGVVDALVMRLGRLDQTVVLPTSSVFKYADHTKDDFTIGKELGVDEVLDGTLQRDGDSVRVSAQLIRLSNGKTVWSETFDEPYHGLFSVQDSISAKLAKALITQMPQPVTERQPNRTTQNPEAYQAYLKGVYFWNFRTKENVAKAINYLEQAVKIDPDFALAHAVLADSYYVCVANNWDIVSMREAYTRADVHATQALSLDDSMAQAHTARAGLRLIYRDYGEAEREFRRALELDPRYAVAHLRYGYFLFGSANLNEALDQMKLALELDPVSPTANTALGYVLFMSRDYDGAIRCYKKALEFQPEMTGARINLGETYVQKRMFDEARIEFDKIKTSDPLAFAAEMACLDGAAGDQRGALQVLSQVSKSSDHGALSPCVYAAMYAAVNDKDAAFGWLEKADANRINVAQVRFNPQYDSLRKDPRFEDWLKRHQS
jgi:DNA-binding winged helix-turn-helix (wHTH) protein/TolB-like protein/tetratricopeptide (TPR) repeat protein